MHSLHLRVLLKTGRDYEHRSAARAGARVGARAGARDVLQGRGYSEGSLL